jgi:uncharacterized membrane protein
MPASRFSQMFVLTLASFFLIATHLVPSASPVRVRLIATLGKRGFYIAYGLISTLALGLFVWTYRSAGPGDWLYGPFDGARPLAVAGMPIAIFLVIGRLTTPAADELRGIYRITTIPGSLGTLLWTLLHLLNVGEDRTVLLFGAMACIAGIAVVKNAVAATRRWPRGSALPFAAMFAGRLSPDWSGIGWIRLGMVATIYVMLLYLHPIVIGVNPLAGL